MTKAELRQKYLAKQTAFSQRDRAAKSRAISDLFFDTADLSNIKNLHLFLPIEKFNEVDTHLLAERVWKEFPHIRTLVPRVDFETNDLLSLELTPETKLEKNAWEIEEPPGHEVVDAEAIDIVLIPGVCFDLEGHRVGYGKG
ncbi:MAG: 5-formyltetrahydrofolate cyclo-ligase, partial [Acidobacteriota bacterium]